MEHVSDDKSPLFFLFLFLLFVIKLNEMFQCSVMIRVLLIYQLLSELPTYVQ